VTGQPAVRRVQWVTSRLLVDLWRIIFRTDAGSSLAGVYRIGLWESTTGLYFFDPPLEGDHTFYDQFYTRLRRWGLFDGGTVREEFLIASRFVVPGARVLDVGCGYGDFGRCVPQAEYIGLDPHFAREAPIKGIRNETLGQHLVHHAASYDAVGCFQVLEHVRDPKALFAGIVQATRPGGLIFIGVPHVPSALTRIPNFLLNAPPHHLSWWTKTALLDLAKTSGAIVESVENVPWGKVDSPVYWIERCSPIKCSDVHFRGAIKWHLAAAAGYLLGLGAFKLFGVPRKPKDEGAGLLMIARRPV
jgi:SAM-dependent methyltransferase